jgi:hypothetical protein
LFRSRRKKPGHFALQYSVGLAGLIEGPSPEMPMPSPTVCAILAVIALVPSATIAAVPQDAARTEAPLVALGYDLLFLSADRPELLYSSLKEPGLNYRILADARMTAARAYGVAFRVDDVTAARYKGFGIDLEAASGETHHELPVPAVFIVDRSGVIRPGP